jgi:hypothetical protein
MKHAEKWAAFNTVLLTVLSTANAAMPPAEPTQSRLSDQGVQVEELRPAQPLPRPMCNTALVHSVEQQVLEANAMRGLVLGRLALRPQMQAAFVQYGCVDPNYS